MSVSTVAQHMNTKSHAQCVGVESFSASLYQNRQRAVLLVLHMPDMLLCYAVVVCKWKDIRRGEGA